MHTPLLKRYKVIHIRKIDHQTTANYGSDFRYGRGGADTDARGVTMGPVAGARGHVPALRPNHISVSRRT